MCLSTLIQNVLIHSEYLFIAIINDKQEVNRGKRNGKIMSKSATAFLNGLVD